MGEEEGGESVTSKPPPSGVLSALFVFGCAGREDVIKTRSFRTIFERIFYPSPALLSAPLNGVAPFHASAPHLAPTTPAIVVTFDGLMDVVELCTVLLSFASCLVVFFALFFRVSPFLFRYARSIVPSVQR